MTQLLTYTPADPASVTDVTQLRLYPDATRTGTPVVDVGPATPLGNGQWSFSFPDPAPGTYYAKVTTTYTDASTADDDTDVITLPVATPAQGADALGLWVQPAELPQGVGSEEQRAMACVVASEVLWGLSGRRWAGLRSDHMLVRPTAPGISVLVSTGWVPWWPARGMVTVCSCHAPGLDPQLPGPLSRVVRLTLGTGDTAIDVPAEQIQIVDRRVIRVVPGADTTTDPLAVNRWPTWEGVYPIFPWGAAGCGRDAAVDLIVEWGTPPTDAGAGAALTLAGELLKGIVGDASCKIAGNVTTVNRQGVTVLLDPKTFLDKGRTGVPLVDLWLTTVNPHKLTRPPEVWWPEADAAVRLS